MPTVGSPAITQRYGPYYESAIRKQLPQREAIGQAALTPSQLSGITQGELEARGEEIRTRRTQQQARNLSAKELAMAKSTAKTKQMSDMISGAGTLVGIGERVAPAISGMFTPAVAAPTVGVPMAGSGMGAGLVAPAVTPGLVGGITGTTYGAGAGTLAGALGGTATGTAAGTLGGAAAGTTAGTLAGTVAGTGAGLGTGALAGTAAGVGGAALGTAAGAGAGAATGAATGAAVGATAGSVVPGIGTVVGALVGLGAGFAGLKLGGGK